MGFAITHLRMLRLGVAAVAAAAAAVLLTATPPAPTVPAVAPPQGQMRVAPVLRIPTAHQAILVPRDMATSLAPFVAIMEGAPSPTSVE